METVGIKIDANQFNFWADVGLVRCLDEFSTLSFRAPFEPEREDFRVTFEPFTFKRLEVTVGGASAFTGTLIGVEPEITPQVRRVAVSGYALPAVLHDCDPPASSYPLEFSGLTLLQIGEALCKPFGFRAVMHEGVEDTEAFVAKKRKVGPRGGKGKRGSKFDRVALEPGDNQHGFLVGLCQQRGVVMRDDPEGNLLFIDSASARGPVANFTAGEAPLVSVSPRFNPQEYYSELTAFTPPKKGNPGGRITVKNPYLTGVVRPHSFKVEDVNAADAPAAAVAKMGRMFANMVSWEIVLPTWRTPDGELWEPNMTITLLAPEASIFKVTELLIRKVTLRQSQDEESTTLEVVLPGAFDGAVPADLPWKEGE